MNLRGRGLTFDDVLIVPQRSSVQSRHDISTRARVVGDVEVDVPIVASPMDTVTDVGMAEAMAEAGGIGILHRFLPPQERFDMVESVADDVPFGVAIGINAPDNTGEMSDQLLEAGADFVCVDVAHAHHDNAVDTIAAIDGPVMAGTIATADAAQDLVDAGADSLRVGVGSGSACTTRINTGVGVPQMTAIADVAAAVEGTDVTVIADGGIRTPGDASKALLGGADAVIMGGELAVCEESAAPVTAHGNKLFRGMASESAQIDMYGDASMVEGESFTRQMNGSVQSVLDRYQDGIRSAISYCGADTLDDARDAAAFVEVTGNTVWRNGAHGHE